MPTVQYVAFLRGINVSGHHKVPMVELRQELEIQGFEQIKTLLNSGNIVFKGPDMDLAQLEQNLAGQLKSRFGFPIPTIIRTAADLQTLKKAQPFKSVTLTKQIRRYISFLKTKPATHMDFPWQSEDGSFRILDIRPQEVISVLDLARANTPNMVKKSPLVIGIPSIG